MAGAGGSFQSTRAVPRFPILTQHETFSQTSQGDHRNGMRAPEIKEREGYEGHGLQYLPSSSVPPSKEIREGRVCFWEPGYPESCPAA